MRYGPPHTDSLTRYPSPRTTLIHTVTVRTTVVHFQTQASVLPLPDKNPATNKHP